MFHTFFYRFLGRREGAPQKITSCAAGTWEWRGGVRDAKFIAGTRFWGVRNAAICLYIESKPSNGILLKLT